MVKRDLIFSFPSTTCPTSETSKLIPPVFLQFGLSRKIMVKYTNKNDSCKTAFYYSMRHGFLIMLRILLFSISMSNYCGCRTRKGSKG